MLTTKKRTGKSARATVKDERLMRGRIEDLLVLRPSQPVPLPRHRRPRARHVVIESICARVPVDRGRGMLL